MDMNDEENLLDAELQRHLKAAVWNRHPTSVALLEKAWPLGNTAGGCGKELLGIEGSKKKGGEWHRCPQVGLDIMLRTVA